MKKTNNIISDWLNKYGDPEIDKLVEKEIENGVKSPLINIDMKNTNKKLDLDKLEQKLDEQLELENEESLTKWLTDKRLESNIDDICLTYRHDFGLLSEDDKELVRRDCRRWFQTFLKYK